VNCPTNKKTRDMSMTSCHVFGIANSLKVRRRQALKSVKSLSEDLGSLVAARLEMSRNFSPNLIIIKISEKINVLFFYYIKLL
jgi:hypothetical protein